MKPVRLTRTLFPSLLLVALLLGACSQVSEAPAVLEPQTLDLVVTNLNDSGDGSLRAAIAAVPTEGSGTITFAAGLTGEIKLESQLVVSAKAITIEGPASGGIIIHGQDRTRIFHVNSFNPAFAARLTLSNMTLMEGRADNGGAIWVGFGQLVLSNSTISDSVATSRGGGIFVVINGAASITNSTVSKNRAVEGGGVFGLGFVTITNSTFSGNMASEDGGGIHSSGSLSVTNSTFVGNSAIYGGGIFSKGTTTVTNSTLAGNRAQFGGGIRRWAGTLTLNSSIVALNTSPSPPENPATLNVDGIIASGSHNLIGGDPGLELDADGKPKLADNGGPTKTIALLAGSPAIDTIPVGTNGCGSTITQDQRGVSRPQGSRCDIGAYELISVPPVLTIHGNGALDRRTGVATVSGTMTCETPGNWTVRVEVRQRQRKAPVEGFAQTTVDCGSGSALWSAAVVPTSGKFKAGLADVAAETPGANPSNRVLMTVNLR